MSGKSQLSPEDMQYQNCSLVRLLGFEAISERALTERDGAPNQEEEPVLIVREERIDCVCGVPGEDSYDGMWIQCDSCDAWLHGRCINMRRAPIGTLAKNDD